MKNSQQPAFPVRGATGVPVNMEDGYPWEKHAIGLTKREYFAAMAMQGYMANTHTPHQDPNNVAKYSIECADELLKQLSHEHTSEKGG